MAISWDLFINLSDVLNASVIIVLMTEALNTPETSDNTYQTIRATPRKAAIFILVGLRT
jgi:hypothetical protein